MAKTNSIPVRTDPSFAKEIRDMQLKRINSGKDNPLSPTKSSRITLAMTRHEGFSKIKTDIINADLK